jgi:translation initiation factor 2 alpha subunit (eIF-2alpha)
MDYIYDKIVWPFYEGKYEHALDVFQMAVEDNSIILNIPNTDPDVKAKLLKEIQRRLTP